MAVGLASGDVTAGAIGTVTYVDGDKVWSFGHPLDAAGRRALFLQDAYVYAIINNPVGSQDLTTYKFAAPGHDLGTLTNDAASARRRAPRPAADALPAAGRGPGPGLRARERVELAHRRRVGARPALRVLGAGTGRVAWRSARSRTTCCAGVPLRQSGSMCVRIGVVGLPKPMRFCNRYHGGGRSGVGGGAALASDFGTATSISTPSSSGRSGSPACRWTSGCGGPAPGLPAAGQGAQADTPRQARDGDRHAPSGSTDPRLTRRFSVFVPRTTPRGVAAAAAHGRAGRRTGLARRRPLEILDLERSRRRRGCGQRRRGTGPRSLKAVARPWHGCTATTA